MAEKTQISYDPLRLTILALLAEQPCHPYEMQRLIRQRKKDFAIVPPRTLYHAIERLHQAGLIEPVETNREGKRPERTIYQVTEEGQEEFQTWLSEMLTYPAEEHPAFTVALSFLSSLSAETVLRALLGRAAALEGKVAGLTATLRVLHTQLPRLVILELEYTLALRQAELVWVQAVIDDIRAGKLSWDLGGLNEKLLTSRKDG
ncbi:MAG: PadR family transcriptional regulator [Caldilineaceae bacterium]